MEPTAFDHLYADDLAKLHPTAQDTLMDRWNALRRGRDPYHYDRALAFRDCPHEPLSPAMGQKVSLFRRGAKREELAEVAESMTIRYEGEREVPTWLQVLVAFVVVVVIVVVWGLAHGLDMPPALGGK